MLFFAKSPYSKQVLVVLLAMLAAGAFLSYLGIHAVASGLAFSGVAYLASAMVLIGAVVAIIWWICQLDE